MSKFIGLLVCLLSMSSCDHKNVLRSPDLQWPTVTGIYVTDNSANLVETWGSPKDNSIHKRASGIVDTSGILPAYYEVLTPYPNPSDGVFSIRFQLPTEADVKMWAVQASIDPDEMVGNGPLYVAPGLASQVLLAERRPAGFHEIIWRRDKNLPDGFYRIYVQLGNELGWRDVAIFEPCNLPPGLKSAANIECN